MERAGAAICTNSVAEITFGVPPRGATYTPSLDGNGSGTCVGYPRTLRPRSSARESGDSVVLCVSGGTVSQSTKSTETTKSKLREGSRGYDPSL